MPSSGFKTCALRSEEHTSELQSHDNLVCPLLLEKKKITLTKKTPSHPAHMHAARSIFDRSSMTAVLTGGSPSRLQQGTAVSSRLYFFFFNDTATTEIYTLSLHDALPISHTEGFLCPSIARKTPGGKHGLDRKSTRLNSSHTIISYAVFCLKKKKKVV